MREYIIKRLPDGVARYPLNGAAFLPEACAAPYDGIPVAPIANYPWSDGAYEPEAYARVGWNEGGLHVLLYAREERIQAKETRCGGRVCDDSCLEFFFMPFPGEDARYLNVEMNPNAVAHIGLGDGRHGRTAWQAVPGGMNPVGSAHEDGWWAVAYTVPMDFIASCFGGRTLEAGDVMRGNFYKCDESIHPHFGTWNLITAPGPDFHRPECFGEMKLGS